MITIKIKKLDEKEYPKWRNGYSVDISEFKNGNTSFFANKREVWKRIKQEVAL
jgi:hypothetical protein